MFYIMSDIHGCLDKFEAAIKKWGPDKERLVLMGDYIDRGPDSLGVIQKIMELKETHKNVTVLKGNHEDMLLQWLKSEKELLGFYYTMTHEETLKSFLKERFKKESRLQRGLSMIHMFKKELKFLDNLDCYYESDNIIFVHAGINLRADNWRLSKNDLLWIRNDFFYSSVSPEKRVFFGHTPTRMLHRGNVESDKIWISPDNMKVGIDGAASMGGKLNALRVSENGSIIEVLQY